MDNNIAITEF